ncbi:MAG: hypothetical protein A2583_11680 [Bdellovibrionales bacterium RIFOXYD1_FULL_53_11]|nr:MAG: hypothetical protein A2583_11680 [Bdellovibrionales bacterium RIFOXYD1_FULL_53_11]
MDKPVSANVFLFGHKVGEIVHHPARGFFFQYDKEFLTLGINISPRKLKNTSNIIPIDAALQKVRCFSGLPGVFADSLPDKFGNELLSRHFKEKGFDPKKISPVQKLLYVGNTAMGALEYQPMEKDGDVPSTIVPLEIRKLVEQAKKVIRGEIDSKIPEIMLIGTSAGGARAKGLVGWNRTNNEVVSGTRNLPGEFEHWIIKFDGTENSEKGWGKIEFTYAAMARMSGIDMPEVHLLHEENRSHFMTKRFDRINGEKVHVHSLCGLLELDYDQHRLFDYSSFIRETLELTKHVHDVEQVFRRMVFNILARNQDDHLKNSAFIMNKTGKWRLAPAYDLCFSIGGWCDDNQLTVNGKPGSEVKVADLLELAGLFGVKKADEIIENINSSILQWEELANTNKVAPEKIEEIAKAHKERRASSGI